MADGPTQPDAGGATYAAAGVDIEAGEAAVERIRSLVDSTARPEVIGGIGDFGGMFALDTARFHQPVLVAATDGIGTKALVAQATGRYATVGIDLVAMCVDDLVCSGAEPLFFLDYIATGAVDPVHMAALVAGVAHGCRQVGRRPPRRRDGRTSRDHAARRVRPGRLRCRRGGAGRHPRVRRVCVPATC